MENGILKLNSEMSFWSFVLIDLWTLNWSLNFEFGLWILNWAFIFELSFQFWIELSILNWAFNFRLSFQFLMELWIYKFWVWNRGLVWSVLSLIVRLVHVLRARPPERCRRRPRLAAEGTLALPRHGPLAEKRWEGGSTGGTEESQTATHYHYSIHSRGFGACPVTHRH